MDILDFAKQLLEGDSLQDKLIPISEITKFDTPVKDIKIPKYPARSKKIDFDDSQAKFPKVGSLHVPERRAKALHFFANHELLAIEMMAAALLKFPGSSSEQVKIRQGILNTIADEQKHFKLYLSRMNDLGVDFGDYSLNDFFWRQMANINDFADFFAVMALTFEAANLDFAKFYAGIFREVEDQKTAKIMDIVYEDEISHVGLGRNWLNIWRGDKSLWEYYQQILPGDLTPARSKGMVFDIKGRELAGLDHDFIEKQKNYSDKFKVTERKEWKK